MLNPKIRRIALDGVLAALYFVLTLVSVRAGNLRITFASLTVIIAVLLFGVADGCIVAALGELLNQLVTYGFSLLLPLWILPPVIRALCIGGGIFLLSRLTRDRPERQPELLYPICIVAAVVTTASNTGVIWLDSIINHYYSFAYVFGDFLLRLGTGIVTAAVMTTIAMPLVALLRRYLLAHTH